MKNPLVNILIRTSNRPNFFNKCYESIREQTYKNIRIIVSYDDYLTQEYVKDYNVDKMVPVEPINNWSQLPNRMFLPGFIEKPFPPNEYFNTMCYFVRSGYVLYLDDDNQFADKNSLERIVSHIANKNQMLFWRVQFPGYVVPNNENWGGMPVCCQMDTGGFSFHTDYLKYAVWDDYNYADFRTAMCLYLHVPEKIFINEVLTALQFKPGSGLRHDLPSELLEPQSD